MDIAYGESGIRTINIANKVLNDWCVNNVIYIPNTNDKRNKAFVDLSRNKNNVIFFRTKHSKGYFFIGEQHIIYDIKSEKIYHNLSSLAELSILTFRFGLEHTNIDITKDVYEKCFDCWQINIPNNQYHRLFTDPLPMTPKKIFVYIGTTLLRTYTENDSISIDIRENITGNRDLSKLIVDMEKDNILTFQTIYGDFDLYNKRKLQAYIFRLFCYKYRNNLLCNPVPNIPKESIYEAVLIEFRIMPHIEFVLRNAVIKLGDKWSHTVICGTRNSASMLQICSAISSNIKVVVMNYDNININTYNNLLHSIDFWKQLHGDKILIHQEDSIVFKENIHDFLDYDYIGAPWPWSKSENKQHYVGNGGFSLRTRQIMIDILTRCPKKDLFGSEQFVHEASNTTLTYPPEDLFFTRYMLEYNYGKLASQNIANAFSTETILNKNSLGGHQFFAFTENWIPRMIHEINTCVHLCTTYIPNTHRGGWADVRKGFDNYSIFKKDSLLNYYDAIDIDVVLKNTCPSNKSWCGLSHFTSESPSHIHNENVVHLFKDENFKESLSNCKFIVALSSHMMIYIRNTLKELNFTTPVYFLKHPIVESNIVNFSLENYINNNDKILYQIGQQLRKVTSIYRLNIEGFKKHCSCGEGWGRMKWLLDSEIKNFGLTDLNLESVTFKQFSNEEYDKVLSQNIVFIDLYSASANNTVLECIVRHTPVIVNKIPGVTDYLGEDYPLYFTNLDEVPALLSLDKISAAHNYLKYMNKDDIQVDYFVREMGKLFRKYRV